MRVADCSVPAVEGESAKRLAVHSAKFVKRLRKKLWGNRNDIISARVASYGKRRQTQDASDTNGEIDTRKRNSQTQRLTLQVRSKCNDSG